MKVYPASRNRQRCIDAVAALKAAGHTVTHNWADGPKCTYTHRDAEIAATDVIGVRTAQVLLLLWEEGMLGANVEFGIALGLNKRIIVVGWLKHVRRVTVVANMVATVDGMKAEERDGVQGDRNVFYRLPSVVHASSLEDAVLMLNEWREQEAARG